MTDLHKNLKEALHNKTGIVEFPSYDIRSSISDEVQFNFVDFIGINLLVNLEWNSEEIHNKVNRKIVDGDYDLSYKQRDALLDDLIPFIKKLQIKIGMITYYSINSIENFYNKDGKLYGLHLTLRDGGGQIKIHNIK